VRTVGAQEVEAVATASRSGTTVVPDKGISAEALKYGGAVLWELLALAFSALLRGDDPPPS
jgi:hypothetical protein